MAQKNTETERVEKSYKDLRIYAARYTAARGVTSRASPSGRVVSGHNSRHRAFDVSFLYIFTIAALHKLRSGNLKCCAAF